MRALVREEGLEDVIEIDSAGTGAWHVGDPPDARATAAAQRPRHRAGGRGAAGHPATTSRDFDLLLAADAEQPARPAARRAGRRRARRSRLLREFDPAAAGAPATSTCPIPTTASADGFEHVLDLVEAACRGLLDDAARRRPAVTAEAAAAALGQRRRARRAGHRRRPQRRLAARARRRRAGVRQDARRRRAGRVRGRGRRPALAGEPPARCRVPEVLAADEALPRAAWLEPGGSTRRDEEELGRGLARAARGGRARVRAPPPGAPRRRCASARSSCRPRRARLARRSTPRTGSRRWREAAAAARCRPAVRAAIEPCARGCRSSPARPSRRRGCTATCGAATSWPTRRRAPADRPGRLRRPPRGRPGHAAAVRRPVAAARSPPTPRSHPLAPGHEARVRSGSSSPCSSTRPFGGGYGEAAVRAARRATP